MLIYLSADCWIKLLIPLMCDSSIWSYSLVVIFFMYSGALNVTVLHKKGNNFV